MQTREHRIVSLCPEDTFRIGALLGQYLTNGSVIALSGELGSGKTCLAQGIAQGLQVPRGFYVTSPSYSLVNEYPGRLRLFHVDLYRVQSATEIEDLGLPDIMSTGGVAVIEWAEKLPNDFSDECLSISISILHAAVRELHLVGYGRGPAELVEKCEREFRGGR